MKSTTIISNSESDTVALGFKLAKILRSGDIICLYGDLGAGKTTFVRGVAKGLGVKQDLVHSPTFTIMNIYEKKKGLSLFHFDLYRLETIDDILDVGYDEFLFGDGVSVIEWSEKLGDLLPDDNISISLKHKSLETREIKITANGLKSECIKDHLDKIKI